VAQIRPCDCDLQPRLSELLKRPLSKTLAPCGGKISMTTPNFLFYNHATGYMVVRSVCQARFQSGTPFWVISKKRFWKNGKYQKNMRFHWLNVFDDRGYRGGSPTAVRPSDPALCGSCPLVTPYYCRLGDLLCLFCVYLFVCALLSTYICI